MGEADTDPALVGQDIKLRQVEMSYVGTDEQRQEQQRGPT